MVIPGLNHRRLAAPADDHPIRPQSCEGILRTDHLLHIEKMILLNLRAVTVSNSKIHWKKWVEKNEKIWKNHETPMNGAPGSPFFGHPR